MSSQYLDDVFVVVFRFFMVVMDMIIINIFGGWGGGF